MKKILIFGDSYSTFAGLIPEGYAPYYPNLDVLSPGDTWWKKLATKTGSELVQNNSWSGSTIGYTGYGNSDCSQDSSFIYRYRKLKSDGFFASNPIDTVLVFGGTNDSWADAPLGELQFSNFTEADLYNVLPAICYFMYTLKTDLPSAKIVFIINTELKPEIMDGMEKAAKYFGVEAVRLQSIDKQEGHPTEQGMTDICEALIQTIEF